ncbi:MAG: 1-(5-phosphoribosyl)-5-[(5-phosphoribosylamino)methylideneamino]imidazole-4-carboxamide isomerase [Spirochaetales bacterium]|nr:1-(5-phosphoribosyl)-5-[(5-phosphoribosylamino)methylideneamino]imidazole-4-carboxamide isomerase [Spirochaetales bacterium]
MEIIPAIDIIDGKYVRLTRGDYEQKKVYGNDPLTMAKEIADAGIKRLHLVDLDGAKAKKVVNLKVLEEIAQNTALIIDVGGGLQSKQDFSDVFNAGAHMATVGSLAARDRDLTLELLAIYGGEKLILGADSLDGMIAVSGWQESTSFPLFDFITTYLEAGFLKVIATDISRDGMLSGSALELYRDLLERVEELGLTINLIASGGVNSLEDISELKEAGLSGAIIGKALYEGIVTLEELAQWVE